MPRKTGQKSLVTLIAHASTIALIATVMPIGADSADNRDAWFGAPFSHAAQGVPPVHKGRQKRRREQSLPEARSRMVVT